MRCHGSRGTVMATLDIALVRRNAWSRGERCVCSPRKEIETNDEHAKDHREVDARRDQRPQAGTTAINDECGEDASMTDNIGPIGERQEQERPRAQRLPRCPIATLNVAPASCKR